MKRVPIEQRFWGVIDPSGQLYPHAVSFHRSLAIKRFITSPDPYGTGKTWPFWKRRGFRVIRLQIEPAKQ
jgi:hypothetical protein